MSKKEAPPPGTHSSGKDEDPVNSREDRFQADPALAPELAREAEKEAAKKD